MDGARTPSGCGETGSPSPSSAATESNKPAPGQRRRLSTDRVRSSIPLGDARPAHQTDSNAHTWTYPSEQMFFNAMRRKGWVPKEDDMPSVVAIHNTVNERAWREVLAWEALHSSECAGIKLLRFCGKPQDYSPKARLMNLLGYKLPFDRHDWVIDRCGKEVRYVIDFYNAAPEPGKPIGMHLDVRPALDSLQAAVDRIRMQLKWIGILARAQQQQQAPPPQAKPPAV